jgi:hypothetical protein
MFVIGSKMSNVGSPDSRIELFTRSCLLLNQHTHTQRDVLDFKQPTGVMQQA